MNKKRISDILIVGLFLIGLSLLLYPSISQYWNSFHQSKAIATYVEEIAEIDDGTKRQVWEEACKYNEDLYERGIEYYLSDQQVATYESVLNATGNGIMGYIEIPSVNCYLPIYHGTDDAVLQIAIGHLEWSSLPVGGTNSHCVLSGHRGLPSARLFTDLDKLKEGDIFMMRTLDEILTYEVDQIRIVLPHEVGELDIIEGEDYCTLVTCTPYGINTHRLLVRGHRVDNREIAETIRVPADATQIEPTTVAPALAIPMLLILLIVMLVKKRLF